MESDGRKAGGKEVRNSKEGRKKEGWKVMDGRNKYERSHMNGGRKKYEGRK